jgi:integrase
VPADAFYEWQKLDAKSKQPFAIALKSGAPYAFAGIWERWKDPKTPEPLETFSIINMCLGTLRAILKTHGLWEQLWVGRKFKPLPVENEIGRALSINEQHRLLAACKVSRSRSLYPAVLISLHTGLRNGELRSLRWRQIDLIGGTLTVGKSKTQAGTGRLIPLSATALACMRDWRRAFPACQPEHYVFASEAYAVAGSAPGAVHSIDPTRPILSFKTSWTTARKTAAVCARWHDMRHTFVNSLAEGQASDSTVMALAGHVSRKMMSRYSHIQNEAKRQAIAAAFDGPVAAAIWGETKPSSSVPVQ